MNYEKIPFDEKEMQSGKEYGLPIPGSPKTLMPDYPISVKENLKRLLEGNPVWMTGDVEFQLFNPAIIPENVARGMVIDAERIPFEKLGGKDFFGVEWQFMPETGGSMVRPGSPLLEEAGEWKEKVVFPDLSKLDWAGSAEKNKFLISSGRPVKMVIFTGFFERLISFMDMEGALIAMVDEDQQDDVKELFEKLADFYIEEIGYMKKYYNFDILWFHDDWGSQRAPLFAYGTIEEMVLPYLKRVVDACHEMGVIFELHSCGKVESLVPIMVEAGVDMWDGQPMNDKVKLSHEFQGKICVEIDANDVTPSMSDEEVKAYAEDMVEKHAKGVLLSKTFKTDTRVYKYIYELSRKKYSE